MDTPKRKRLILDTNEKLKIIEFSTENPKISQQEITNHFCALWDIPVKRRTVGDIIANKTSITSDDIEGTSPRKRHRSAHHTDLESALFMWFTNARNNNIPVTDEILKTKANRWLCRFKSRHGISSHIISGESAGVDQTLITDVKGKAREIMGEYALNDSSSPSKSTDDERDEEDVESSPPPTHRQMKTFMIKAFKFFESSDLTEEDDINALTRLNK
ncbi:hypothetical protein KUTeg_014836 [Tegillarca granosa]|uniref:HTH CENPB-type domain-containing protein n=1 Tax=Tegillarca granosa TaxID=220873 RepID=A0ABQ9EQV4_TEGGR|nr:hypothetical protein KUTeg_014836 [Tegillarca granosa]